MTYYYFVKIKVFNEDMILCFEQGELGKPICIFDSNAIKRIIKEFNKKEE